jgi:hypothetical protein
MVKTLVILHDEVRQANTFAPIKINVPYLIRENGEVRRGSHTVPEGTDLYQNVTEQQLLVLWNKAVVIPDGVSIFQAAQINEQMAFLTQAMTLFIQGLRDGTQTLAQLNTASINAANQSTLFAPLLARLQVIIGAATAAQRLEFQSLFILIAIGETWARQKGKIE